MDFGDITNYIIKITEDSNEVNDPMDINDSEKHCDFCALDNHNTKEHLCRICRIPGQHSSKDCPTKPCKFCKCDNHSSKEHLCKTCDMSGDHSAMNCPQKTCRSCGIVGHERQNHCRICNGLGHSQKDHKCRLIGCRLYEEHVHKCKYCIHDHTTEEHKCYKCGDLGHSGEDHDEKVFCGKCNLKGHSINDVHFECTKCQYVIIGNIHYFCDKCNVCSYKRHQGPCKYCNGCLVPDDLYSYEQDEGDLRCSKCYKRPGDLEKHDVMNGLRIPFKK